VLNKKNSANKCENKRNETNLDLGNLEDKRFCSLILTLNIIITNKNKTAIAPTYTMIKVNPKKSTPNRKRITAALKKVKIRKSIDSIELTEDETTAPQETSKKHNNK
jgi:hypothetical protein